MQYNLLTCLLQPGLAPTTDIVPRRIWAIPAYSAAALSIAKAEFATAAAAAAAAAALQCVTW
jgi:hypothetical protein